MNSKRLLRVVLMLAMAIWVFAGMAISEAAIGEQVRADSIFERLQTDYATERLTLDKYILYKAWAVFTPEKLSNTPYAIPPDEVQVIKSGTPMILEILDNWHLLSRSTQEKLQFILLRPVEPGGDPWGNQPILPQRYETANFVFHYTTGVNGEYPLHYTTGVNGGDPANATTLGEVQELATYFEESRTFLLNRGFEAPPSDDTKENINNSNPDGRYDVFIYSMWPGGYAMPEQHPDSPSYSHIGINSKIMGNTNLMQIFVAHELFHAVQFYYDVTEEHWWMEATATYMEDEIFPGVDDNYNFLPRWFNFPDRGLKTSDDFHEYGSFIFAKRLSEVFGDDIIREIWVENQSTGGLDSIGNVLGTKGSDIVSLFTNFTKANFFLEDFYADGVGYRSELTGTTIHSGVWLEFQYSEATHGLPFTIDNTNVSRDARMDPWATDYITFTLSPGTAKYRISFDGLDLTTDYQVNLVTKKGTVITDRIFSLDAQKDGYIDLPYDTYDNVVLIIMNAGDTATANPSWKVTIKAPVLSVTPDSFLDFGEVIVGESRDINFTATNTGEGTLTGDASVAGPFSIVSGSPFSLETDESTPVTVRFSPTATGFFSRTVTFTSNGGNLNKDVSGVGTEPPADNNGICGICFIATAAYGTPLAQEVEVLKMLRDEHLLTNPLGRILVSAYERISPPLAEFIRRNPVLKSGVRIILRPLIWVSEKIVK